MSFDASCICVYYSGFDNLYFASTEWSRVGGAPLWTSPHTNVTYTLGHRFSVSCQSVEYVR